MPTPCHYLANLLKQGVSQAGAVKALHEMYDLDKYSLTGASAGAVIAVLAGCKIDMDYALDVAERLNELL